MTKSIHFISLIFLVLVGCSNIHVIQSAEVFQESQHRNQNCDSRMLGVFNLLIDKENVLAELSLIRGLFHTDTLEEVDITAYLTSTPCSNCVRISKVGLNSDENIVVTIGVKHPFKAGDPSKAISSKNRADLHVFNVEGIIVSNDTNIASFPSNSLDVLTDKVVNADGYTSYFDEILDNSFYQTSSDIHPYILHFDDYSGGNFTPYVPTGFASVTDPPPSGNLIMPMGSDYDYKDYIFNVEDKISFIYVIGCTFPITTLSYLERFYPEYRVPQHMKKAASEIHVIPPSEKLKSLDPSYIVTLRVEVTDPSNGVATGNELDRMKYDSSVEYVKVEIPNILSNVISKSGNQSLYGSGHSVTDPLVYEFNISNELSTTSGIYTGLVKVKDSYPANMNEIPSLINKDGLTRVSPGQGLNEFLFSIPEFATYQTFKIEVEEGSANPPTYYDVGPGYPYADPSEVPWESIEENSVVRIHWRDEPYRDKWVIARSGTINNPIIVQGVLDQGRRPVISGENAKTRLELDYWNEPRSVIKVGGSSFPSERPMYIIVENLDIQSAHEIYSFKDDAGNDQNYAANGASIHIEMGDHITIRNCILHDSGNGLFVSSDSADILIRGNYIYDNGNSSSAYEHNSYTEAKGIVFEYNHYGLLKTGSLGNNLKDRSAGTVIRYNWIESGSRMCDLVDSGNADLINDPSYRETFVYGNILIKDDLHSNGGVIHYGGDSANTANYRKGTLWCFNNSIVSYRTTRTTFFQISSNDEHVKCFNNLFYDHSGGNLFFAMSDYGDVEFYFNWLQTGWNDVNGTLQGTFNDHDNIEGSNPDFVDFASQDFHLKAVSDCVNAGTDLPASILPEHDLLYQYVKHQGQEFRPQDPVFDIGAFEKS